MAEVNTKPCANHGESAAVRNHCWGAATSECDVRLGEPLCHIAAYCKRCDWQWVETCNAHQGVTA